jgi:hypothetical protein
MIGFTEGFFQFDLLIFGLSFLATELVARKLYPCFLLIRNKKIRIHHAYVGAILAFFSALTGQIVLLNVGLGAMTNDIIGHLRKKISKFLNSK